MIAMLRRCIFVIYLCGDLGSHAISLISILSYVYNHQWILGRHNSYSFIFFKIQFIMHSEIVLKM